MSKSLQKEKSTGMKGMEEMKNVRVEVCNDRRFALWDRNELMASAFDDRKRDVLRHCKHGQQL
jgi:hypothetical protein